MVSLRGIRAGLCRSPERLITTTDGIRVYAHYGAHTMDVLGAYLEVSPRFTSRQESYIPNPFLANISVHAECL